MEPKTFADLEPPDKVPPVATAFESDEIEKLGDEIACLTPKDAANLNRYLDYFYGIMVKVK